MKNLFRKEVLTSKDSRDSEDGLEAIDAVKSRKVIFHCAPQASITAKLRGPLFFIDASASECDNNGAEMCNSTKGIEDVETSADIREAESFRTPVRNIATVVCNNENDDAVGLANSGVKELLSKCRVGVGFEKGTDDTLKFYTSKKELWRRRKLEREKTKGSCWFDLPATEMTAENERDLELIQMRDALDMKTHYKKNDRFVLPRYFEMGTVIENKADFYSSRIPKSLRKRTIVEELMADTEFRTRQRRKFDEIRSRQAVTRKGAFQHRTYRRRGKQFARKRH